VFFHPALDSLLLTLIHPTIVKKALAERKEVTAAIHNGGKLWLFGRVWLSSADESVIFHSKKVKSRALFRRWLVLSEGYKRELMAFTQERGLQRNIQVIRNGPLPSLGDRTPRSPATLTQVKTIGCLCVFSYRKGVDLLIEAFAQLLQEGRDLKLLLAGHGGDAPKFYALAHKLGVCDRIEWTGWVTNTQSFFDRIDLFCLPTREEPFGIVITEAMQSYRQKPMAQAISLLRERRVGLFRQTMSRPFAPHLEMQLRIRRKRPGSEQRAPNVFEAISRWKQRAACWRMDCAKPAKRIALLELLAGSRSDRGDIFA